MKYPFRNLVFLSMAVSLSIGIGLAQAKMPEVGTIITKANWTEYKEVMADGLIEMFEGNHFWKVPDNVEIEVGPFTPYKNPQTYIEDTEKYAGQPTLREGEGGGIVLENYTAGLPFPNPQEPNLGAKLGYNQYYRYASPFQYIEWYVHFVDRYYNETYLSGYSVFSKMNYLSEPGQPKTMPDTGNNYYTLYQEVLEPEQSRYTSQMVTYFNGTDIPEENYAFIPSMRRSLRLSSASRCSPILGTDWTPEDITRVPGHFRPVFLREQKILTMVNVDTVKKDAFEKPMLFPTRKVGKWEVRDTYVIDVQRAPGFSDGYCYGGRHLYLDKQTFTPLWTDVFDNNGKFFKIMQNVRKPVSLPGHGEGQTVMPILGEDLFIVWDVQNEHISAAETTPVLLGDDVPAKYKDVRRFAMPAGLNEVMR